MKEILLILILQLLYVPLLTLRTIFMVRNKCIISSIFGFVEAIIYIFGLALVLQGEKSILAMLVYSIGFGLGICLGGYIEGKIAIGHIIISVNLKNKNEALINHLRENDFHFSIFEGNGIDGIRYKFDILTNRHKSKELVDIIKSHEPNAFIIVFEPLKYKTRTSIRLK